MIDNNQLRAVSLRVSILEKVIANTVLDIEEIKEFLELDGATTAIDKMNKFYNLIMNMHESDSIKLNNNNFIDIFQGLAVDNEPYQFYNDFLVFKLNDDILKPISERLNILLAIDYNNVPNCEIKQTYLYSALMLALSISPMDMELIRTLNRELQLTLN